MSQTGEFRYICRKVQTEKITTPKELRRTLRKIEVCLAYISLQEVLQHVLSKHLVAPLSYSHMMHVHMTWCAKVIYYSTEGLESGLPKS